MDKKFILTSLAVVSEIADATPLQVSPETKQLANDFIKGVLQNEFGVNKANTSTTGEKGKKATKPATTKSTTTKKSEPDVEEVEDELSDEIEEETDVPETIDMVESDDDVAEIKPERTLQEMIEELPEGDSLLVKPPYSYFASVPQKIAARYLAGVKISEVTNSEAIAEASKNGVNKEFVQLLLDSHNASTKKVTKPITIDEGSKADKVVKKLASRIEMGEELFELMSRGGVDDATIKHYSKIVSMIAKES